jgi:hypothetical protein
MYNEIHVRYERKVKVSNFFGYGGFVYLGIYKNTFMNVNRQNAILGCFVVIGLNGNLKLSGMLISMLRKQQFCCYRELFFVLMVCSFYLCVLNKKNDAIS